MQKSKFTKTVVFVLLIAGALQAGIIAYSSVGGQIIKKLSQEAPDVKAQTVAFADNTSQQNETPEKEIDISKVVLKKEIVDMVTSLDTANAARNIKNYKTLLVALDVPEGFQTRIEEMYSKGYKVQDVLAAYEYLYQNYGNIDELGWLMTQKKDGKAWKDIFKEYKKTHEEFAPRNFDSGMLEKTFKTPGITPDDVIIADRISQESGMDFEELINMRGQGKTWKDINLEFGVVTTSGELPRVSINSTQVSSYMKSTGLSEEVVLEALVLAQRLDEDGKTIVQKIKAGSTKEDILAESLSAKYQ